MQKNYTDEKIRKKLKIEKSLYPASHKTHVLFLYSRSGHGCNIERVFKGTYKQCKNEKEKLENRKENEI